MIQKALVLILMGSGSDKSVMLEAQRVLKDLGVKCIIHISSAHRSSERTKTIVRRAESAGIKVIIAGAGMAAHLAGVVAAETILTVIGVPLTSKSSPLNGVDALYSTVQMPSGIPVATVGIDRADNAGYLAARILAISDHDLSIRLILKKREFEEGVEKKDAELQLELSAEEAKEE